MIRYSILVLHLPVLLARARKHRVWEINHLKTHLEAMNENNKYCLVHFGLSGCYAKDILVVVQEKKGKASNWTFELASQLLQYVYVIRTLARDSII